MRDYENYLNGLINDVHILNDGLTRTDVGALFENGFGFNPTYDHDGFYSSNILEASYPMILCLVRHCLMSLKMDMMEF